MTCQAPFNGQNERGSPESAQNNGNFYIYSSKRTKQLSPADEDHVIWSKVD